MGLKTLLRDAAYERLAGFLGARLKSKVFYFDYFQRHGLHILPNHFYEPIPDTTTLDERIWQEDSTPGIDPRLPAQQELLTLLAQKFAADWNQLPRHPQGEDEYFVHNDAFATVDGELLYGMVRHYKPKRIVEVGSGHSTRVIGKALKDSNRAIEFCSIEPFPLEWVRPESHGLTRVIEQRVQDVDTKVFLELETNDILFIDSSHVVACGSDVNHLVLRILPQLKVGVIVHFHDIFLPREYPRDWIMERKIFWNEQYLVQAFLAGNTDFEILIGASWLHCCAPDLLSKWITSYDPNTSHPASLWIRRTA